ncbi:MAG: ABC transporter ATP-binding protein [Gaiellales bacterium]
MSEPILRATGVTIGFPITRGIIFQREVGRVQAVDGVDLELNEGETLAIVGESGCGKTTLARGLVRLQDIDAGSIEFMGEDITRRKGRGLTDFRRQVTMIFQDPIASLDPRMRIGQSVQEPLDIHGIGTPGERKRLVQEAMERVGLNPEHYNRFPHEFSGGQRQRIGIARAVVLQPRVIVCDEPVSALVVSVQAQIVNLLEDLQRDLGLSYIVIAHDLDVVRRLADRVKVMYLGRVVEEGTGEQVYTAPRHPYSNALLSARPVADPARARAQQRIVLQGDVPSPLNPPSGCRFHPRCPVAQASCAAHDPQLEQAADGHGWACAYPLQP